MVITKVREYLGVGLALLAALACGYGVVNHLRMGELQKSLDLSLSNNEVLINVNDENNDTITALVEQRKIDDKLLILLDKQYDKLANDSKLVRSRLNEIRNNDKEFKELLTKRHPVELGGLLNERASSIEDNNDENKAPE